jgi:hypothetical protein
MSCSKIYVIQLWDSRFGWLFVNEGGRPLAFFKKRDADEKCKALKANAHFRSKFKGRLFVDATIPEILR